MNQRHSDPSGSQESCPFRIDRSLLSLRAGGTTASGPRRRLCNISVLPSLSPGRFGVSKTPTPEELEAAFKGVDYPAPRAKLLTIAHLNGAFSRTAGNSA